MFALMHEVPKRWLIPACVCRAALSELHAALEFSKALRSELDVMDTTLAAAVAARATHGGRDADVLMESSRLRRHERVVKARPNVGEVSQR